MDVFEVGHQFGDYDFQLNDHNPGVSDQGLVWTAPVPRDSITASFSQGSAGFCLSDIQMPDLHDLLTGLWGGGEVDGEGNPLAPVFSSSVSFNAKWFDAGSIQQTIDTENQFVFHNAVTKASITWSSVRRGVRFVSDDGPQTVVFAAIGNERNGSFF